jgi:hypothetical protein
MNVGDVVIRRKVAASLFLFIDKKKSRVYNYKMLYGLPEETIHTLNSIFCKYSGIEQIVLYNAF